MNTYYAQDTVIDSGGAVMIKTEKIPILKELNSSWGNGQQTSK